MIAVTDALLHGHLSVPPSYGTVGVGGFSYSVYGLGWSIIDLPAYALGMVADRVLHITGPYRASLFLSTFVNPLLIAGTATVLVQWTRELFGSARRSVAAALLFAFATPAWAYTKNAFSEPLVALCLVAGAWLLSRPRSVLEDAVAGGLLGLAFLTRDDALPEALVVGVYGLVMARSRWRSRLLSMAPPAAAAGLLVLAYDQVRFGSVLSTGYEQLGYGAGYRRTTVDIAQALVGLIFDPTRGLVWFMPAVVVSVALLPRFARLAPGTARLVVAIFLVAWLEHADLFVPWQAGWAWGPRFLMPLIPFLILPWSCSSWPSRWRPHAWLAAITVVAGVAISVGPVIVEYSRYFFAVDAGLKPGPWPPLYLWQSAIHVLQRAATNSVPAGRMTELGGSAAKIQNGMLLNAPDFWWWFLLHTHTLRAAFIFSAVALLAIGAVAASWKLWALLRSENPGTSPPSSGRPEFD